MKTKYDADKLDLVQKIPNTCGHFKKLDYYAKITEIENKMPSISSLTTNAAVTAIIIQSISRINSIKTRFILILSLYLKIS